MAQRVPVTLVRSIKRHGRMLKQLMKSGGNKRKLILQQAPRTFFSLIQSLFKNILKGKVPAPLNLNRNLLKRVARTKNPNRVIQQNGSGIGVILSRVIPMILSLLPSLFGKK